MRSNALPLRAPIVFSSMAILLAVVNGCNRPSAASPTAQAAQATNAEAPTVSLVKPLRKTIEQPGTIEAFQQTPVYAKIAGYVEKVHKDIGERVREGDLLAELSVPEMVEDLKRKEARVVQAKAGVQQAKKTLAAAAANVNSAKAQVREAQAGRQVAQAEYERFKLQHSRLEGATGVVQKDAVDEARFRRDAAGATVVQAEAKIKSAEALQFESEAKRDKAEADITAAEANLEVVKADRDQTKALLGYAKIPAPFDGIVTRRSVDKGHFVQPAASSGSRGEPLFEVVQKDIMRVFVDVPEADAVLVHRGDPVRVHVQALRGQDFKGEITRTSWSLDTKTRTLRAEIDLRNPEEKLRPGMYAYATITAAKANVWRLPATAVVTRGERSFCYRVENGRAVRMLVQVGTRDGQHVEVWKKQSKTPKPGEEAVLEDFTGSEEIVGSNAATLTDGQAVNTGQK